MTGLYANFELSKDLAVRNGAAVAVPVTVLKVDTNYEKALADALVAFDAGIAIINAGLAPLFTGAATQEVIPVPPKFLEGGYQSILHQQPASLYNVLKNKPVNALQTFNDITFYILVITSHYNFDNGGGSSFLISIDPIISMLAVFSYI